MCALWPGGLPEHLMDALGPGDAIGLLNAIGRYRLHISAVATEKTRCV